MKEGQNIGLKKKIIIAIAVFLVAGISIALVILFGSTPMNVDWDSLYTVENNVRLLAPGEEGNPTDAPALVKMNGDASDWKILQFTDMHLSHKNGKGNNNDITLQKYIDTIMEEKPDLVVLTGDIITSSGGRARAVQFAEIMERLGVYWAYNLGNHEGDAFYKLSRKELMSIIEKYDHCLSDGSVKKTADGTEVWGVGNFVVNLLGENNSVVQSLIFLDSGDAIDDDDAKEKEVKKGSYDYLKDNQIQWYEEQVKKSVELNADVKTMLFIHIPLIEQKNMVYVSLPDESENEEKWTVDTPLEGYSYVKDHVDPTQDHIVKGNDGELVGKVAIADGWHSVAGTYNHEGVSCSQYNSGMYAKMVELRANVNGLFCGHDHINNSILYEDYDIETESPLFLCYGITGGYDAYTLYKKNKSDDPKNLMRGYSVITIHQDSTFDYEGVSFDYDNEHSLYIKNSQVA